METSLWSFLMAKQYIMLNDLMKQFSRTGVYVCSSVSSMMSGLETRSLGRNTLGTT